MLSQHLTKRLAINHKIRYTTKENHTEEQESNKDNFC